MSDSNSNQMKNLIKSGLAFLVFLFIYFISTTSFGSNIDSAGMQWAKNIDNSSLETILELFSKLDLLMLVGFTIVFSILFFKKKNWKMLFFYYFTVAGGTAFNYVLKFTIRRARPEDLDHVHHILGFDIISYSFPSGHVMRASVLFLCLIFFIYLFLKNHPKKTLCIALCSLYILIMGISRILLMDHFITDVLAAVVVSVSWIYLAIFLTNWAESKIPLLRAK